VCWLGLSGRAGALRLAMGSPGGVKRCPSSVVEIRSYYLLYIYQEKAHALEREISERDHVAVLLADVGSDVAAGVGPSAPGDHAWTKCCGRSAEMHSASYDGPQIRGAKTDRTESTSSVKRKLLHFIF
jgi:hypothetical protein